MKTITGTVNFVLEAYTYQDFLRDMDIHNCEVISSNRKFMTYTVKVRGTNRDLERARWFFRNCGTLL